MISMFLKYNRIKKLKNNKTCICILLLKRNFKLYKKYVQNQTSPWHKKVGSLKDGDSNRSIFKFVIRFSLRCKKYVQHIVPSSVDKKLIKQKEIKRKYVDPDLRCHPSVCSSFRCHYSPLTLETSNTKICHLNNLKTRIEGTNNILGLKIFSLKRMVKIHNDIRADL